MFVDLYSLHQSFFSPAFSRKQLKFSILTMIFGDEGKQRNMTHKLSLVGSDRTEPALGLKIKPDTDVGFGPDVLSVAERETTGSMIQQIKSNKTSE